MQGIIYILCSRQIHAVGFCQFFHRCVFHIFHRLESAHQCFPSAGPDSRNVIQNRVYLSFTSQRPVVLNGKAVCFILNPGDQFESLAVWSIGISTLLKYSPSCTVIVILYHTADRNLKLQFFKHLNAMFTCPRPPSIIIRSGNLLKTSDFLSYFFLPVLLFLHAMRKPSGQHLMHGLA